jgi:hypothetical protein
MIIVATNMASSRCPHLPGSIECRKKQISDQAANKLIPDNSYKANFTRCGLIVPETREIARLLLEEATPEAWNHAIRVENRLQTRSPATAVSYAREAKGRLQTMSSGLWKLVVDGNLKLATQAALAATIKHSHLFGDFMKDVVQDELQRKAPELPAYKWNQYMDLKQAHHPNLARISRSTQSKLRQNAYKMLAEAGILSNTRSKALQTVFLEPELIDFLKNEHEYYVLDCLRPKP